MTDVSTPAAATKKIRVGIVGAGTWAEYGHLPALALLPEFELTAVYSRSAEKAHAVAARHGIAYPVTSLQALVEHPEVDLVLVLTQAPQHEAGIRAAIAAGKDVYSEWPLTTSTAVSAELAALASQAGVRHVVGLQRRLAPSYRYMSDLLAEGYIGDLRSVRMHVSVDAFGARRMPYLAYTVPPENFSDLLPIFGGHFLDILFKHFGFPRTMSALTANQIKQVTVVDTGEVLAHTNPDQVLLHGTFANGAVLTVQLEAGKRNNFGVQIDLTGTEGDLRITNATSFGPSDNLLEGARGDGQALQVLPVPAHYNWLPDATLSGSVAELAHLYAAYARDVRDGSQLAPTFADAVNMHTVIDQIIASDLAGARVTLAA
ncbi:Gfo/Idh/MocA family protein [Massilia sp. S19_KUP03_FR1]|uniref:Gfo/Idh/MocA family protein n=1 Tax=Massilia sp. S19_KUP03_FR1 TaxID=3025503 RepID=UPI002FCD8727